MNVGALLQGGVSRVLRTARAVLNAVDDNSPAPDDVGESPAAADFCFRADCDEEHDVAQAWSAFSAASASSAPAGRASLDAFLAVFVSRCSAWSPAEPGTLERAEPARPRGCNAGHPLALLRALADATERASQELDCEPEQEMALHAGHVRVFEALRIVVRSRHNRVQLSRLHAFGSLVRCLAGSVARLALQQGAVLEPSVSSAAVYLAVVSAVSALCTAMEAELRSEGRPLRLASMSDVRLPLVDAHAAAHPRQALASGAVLTEALNAGAVEVLVKLVGAMRRARLCSSSSADMPLEAPTFRCLAALLMHGPTGGVAALQEVGGLEMLLDCVGQPPPAVAHARSELRAQLAALEVCGAAVSVDRESLRRAVNVGMFTRLAATLRWAGSSFSPGLTTAPSSVSEPVSNDQLVLIFDTMRALCEGVADEAGARRTLAERTLLAICSAAFARSDAPRWPGITDHALYFLESLLPAGPLAVAALRSAGADEALFGSALFFWKPLECATNAAAVDAELAARRMLRLRALSLLRAIAIAPSWSCGGVRVDLGIEPELTALLRALDACCTSGDAEGCAALGDVVCVLEDVAPERFALASLAIGAPVGLANMIRKYAQLGEPTEGAASARASLLRAFEAMLASSSSVRIYSAGNDVVPEMLLDMLLTQRRDAHAEHWAFKQLQCIAQEAPCVPRRSRELADSGAAAAGKEPLYRALLHSIVRARQVRAELLPQLLALLQAAAQSGPEERLALAAQGAHVILVELMGSDSGSVEIVRSCVLHAVATLATLLSSCATARDQFALEPGYAALTAALERDATVLTPSVLRQLCLLICGLPGAPLVECPALDSTSALSFRHAGAIPVLLRCLRCSGTDLQLAGLAWLAAGLRSSSAAQCCAAEAALPRLILDWYGALTSCSIAPSNGVHAPALRDALTDTLSVCHAVTAEDIRAAFALLRRKDAPHRRFLVDALCAAAVAARDEPRAFFALPGGVESGIHLTLPLRWLPGRPVTLFVWLRVDELPAVDAALLSLRGTCGDGVLISLSAAHVCAAICTAATGAEAPAVQAQALMSHTIQPRRWQSVAVVLGSGSLGVFGGERARLFIDGAEVATARLRLPRLLSSSALELSAIGAAPVRDDWPMMPPFSGQIASPHIFDDALRLSSIAALHARGPELQLESPTQPSSTTADGLQDAAARCVVAFSAAASSKTVIAAGAGSTACYNIAPVISPAVGEEARSAASPAAVVGASTAVFVFRGVCEAVRALGGLSSALPLLDDVDDDFVASALRFASEVASVPGMDAALLEHALRRRGARTPLSRSVFESAVQLGSASKGGCVSGFTLAYDVAFWALCGSDEACMAQAAFLSSAVHVAPPEARHFAAPQQIADAIAGLRPDCCPQLRRAWLDAATTQMSAVPVSPAFAEGALALAALATHSPESAADAAVALARVLSPENARRRAIAVAFAEAGGCMFSLFAVHSGAPEAQPAALQLLTSLMAALPDASRACDTPGMFGVLRHALMSRMLSPDLRDALLGLACLNAELRAADVRVADAVAPDGSMPQSGPPPPLVHPAALGILLQLLRSCSDQQLRLSTLSTLAAWVEGSVVNAGVLVAHRGWQTWFLHLLYSPELLSAEQQGKGPVPEATQHTLVGSEGAAKQERLLVRRLFGALHAHCLLRFGGPGGGAELDRTMTFAVLHAAYATSDAGVASSMESGSAPHTALCEALTDALELALAPGTRWGPSVAENLSALLFLVDELLPPAATLLPDAPAAAFCAAPSASVWKLSSAACRVLAKLWPSLQAAAAVSQAQAAANDVGAFNASSLRQRALSLLLWTSSESTASVFEHASAACDHAGRFTLRMCLLYARGADADAAHAHLELLIPFLGAARADKSRFDLFCSALVAVHRAFPARSSVVCNLLLAAAVAGEYLPAPASSTADGSHAAESGLSALAGDALSKVVFDQVPQAALTTAMETEAAMVRATEARRQAAVTAQREELARRSAADSLAAAATLEAIRAATAALGQTARARQNAARAATEEEAAAQERRLRHAVRSVSGERGVWAPAVQPAAHWKVDKTEDSKRRRLRLRRDYRHGTYVGSAAAPQQPIALGEQQQADAARMATRAGAVCLPAQTQEGALLSAEDAEASDLPSKDALDETEDEAPPPQAFAERDAVAYAGPGASADELLWTTSAMLVTVKRAISGHLDIHRKHVHFEADPDSTADAEDARAVRHKRRDTRMHWRWPVSRLVAVHCQRYLLQSRALELFLEDRSSAFLALPDRTAAVRAAAAIIRVRPGLPLLDKRRKAEAAARAAERWRRREISNFDYIMTLNTLAGRSYNDLAQYPVFPWVLADYTSERLDLAVPGTLRDLTLPVGALNPARRAALVERFAALAAENDSEMPPFHHGSHYSTPGGVLHWLIRLQPYTALHRSLQGGHFDHGDRLFHSVPAAWAGAWNNAADVRELTPEFFCAPEFLLNGEGHDLGWRQDGQRVDHVTLPPWACGDPAAFIRANAAALECEAVSATLNSWVDLVFGYAQRGPAAVEKLNVFYHLTYEGAVDMERVADERSRAALADQIALFGQTPAQLFMRRHPPRDAVLWPPAALCVAAHGVPTAQPLALLADAAALPAATGRAAVTFISASADGRVLAVCANGSLGLHRLIRPSPAAGAFTFSAALETGYMLGYDGTPPAAGVNSASSRGPSLPPFAASVAASPSCFTVFAGGRLLVSAPHWDARLRVLRLAGGEDVRLLQSLHAHADVVTCAASSFGAAGSYCVTGSRDTTLCVWQLASSSLLVAAPLFLGAAMPASAATVSTAPAPMRAAPLYVLSGHDAPVSCVACSEELDMIASASAGDSTIMIHTLRSGRYMRSLTLPAAASPVQLLISDACGSLIVLLQPAPSSALTTSELCAFNCNGMTLGVAAAGERLAAIALTLDTRAVLTGGERGAVVMRDASTLQELAFWAGASASLTSLCAVADDAVLAGTRDGRVLLWGPQLGADSPKHTRV